MPTQHRNSFGQALPTQPGSSPGFYDHLRVAAPRHRNRQWEKKHQNQKAMYHGVDLKLALRVKQIASDLNVNDGEVARKLLEYALRAYADGDLDLNPRPHPERMRMTLFPFSETVDERRKRGGMPGKKKKLEEPRWRVVTTWRGLPATLKQEIAALASDDGLNVPAGELVTALLRFSLKALEYGLLKLKPVAVISGYTYLLPTSWVFPLTMIYQVAAKS
jgi:hypothetical protein